jgi:hypothetical protein
MELNYPGVIASAAKQSRATALLCLWIASEFSLLAMTATQKKAGLAARSFVRPVAPDQYLVTSGGATAGTSVKT